MWYFYKVRFFKSVLKWVKKNIQECALSLSALKQSFIWKG